MKVHWFSLQSMKWFFILTHLSLYSINFYNIFEKKIHLFWCRFLGPLHQLITFEQDELEETALDQMKELFKLFPNITYFFSLLSFLLKQINDEKNSLLFPRLVMNVEEPCFSYFYCSMVGARNFKFIGAVVHTIYFIILKHLFPNSVIFDCKMSNFWSATFFVTPRLF